MDAATRATVDPLPVPDALRGLAERGQPRRYRKGTLLIQEGDHGDTQFIVMSGRVKAFSIDDRDREIVYGVYGPGEYLGEMSLDGGPRSASVITLEPTVCVVITRQTLREHVDHLLSAAQRGELKDAHALLLRAAEREIFTRAIELAHGNQAKAARWVGVSRLTMREKLIQFGLHPREQR